MKVQTSADVCRRLQMSAGVCGRLQASAGVCRRTSGPSGPENSSLVSEPDFISLDRVNLQRPPCRGRMYRGGSCINYAINTEGGGGQSGGRHWLTASVEG